MTSNSQAFFPDKTPILVRSRRRLREFLSISVLVASNVSLALAQEESAAEQAIRGIVQRYEETAAEATRDLAFKYLGALRKLRDHYAAKGDLDGALAVRREVARRESESPVEYEDGEQNLPSKLQRLVQIYETEKVKLTMPLARRRDQELEVLKATLTMKGDLDGAVEVAEALNNLRSTRSTSDVDSPQPTADLPVEGLVVHYDFNELKHRVVRDISGNRNHAERDEVLTDAEGIEGRALQFVGAIGFAQIEFRRSVWNDLYRRSYTLAAWYRSDFTPKSEDSGGETILIKAGFHQGLHLLAKPDRFAHELWVIDPNKNPTDEPTRVVAACEPRDFKRGQWYHVVGRHDAKARSVGLFVNGKLVREHLYPADAVVLQNDSPWRIGRAGGGVIDAYQQPAKGLIDELRLYDRPLTDAEVAALYLHYSK